MEETEKEFDKTLRPQSFEEYIGNKDLINKIKITMEAVKKRDDPFPHSLFFGGSPGVGKTTLCHVIANEYEKPLYYVNSPSIHAINDLISILTKMDRNSILCLDECHSLNKNILENLLPVLENNILCINLKNKQTVNFDIKPITIIGCTTELGKLPAPFRDRFDILHNMQLYSDEEIESILKNNIIKLGLKIEEDGVIKNIAMRSRGVPRIANRWMRRIRDYSEVKNGGVINNEVVNKAMQLEKIDKNGLSDIDKKYMKTLYGVFQCNPAGIESISATIGEDIITIKEFIEPHLIKKGFIARTKTGRILTKEGVEFIIKY